MRGNAPVQFEKGATEKGFLYLAGALLHSKVTQLVLFEVPVQEKAAGAETTSSFLRLVVAPRETEQE